MSVPDGGAPSRACFGAARCLEVRRSLSRKFSKYRILPGARENFLSSQSPGRSRALFPVPCADRQVPVFSSHSHHPVCREGARGGSTPQNRPGTPARGPWGSGASASLSIGRFRPGKVL